jgi:hypothetical protein
MIMLDIDTFGVPEHFASNVGLIEDAGDGMVRLVYCVNRQGVQIAVCSNVVPARAILRFCRDAEAVATQVIRANGTIN